jgi:hypothetical protein
MKTGFNQLRCVKFCFYQIGFRPWRKLESGTMEEDDFFCERHAFSRWIVGDREKIKKEIKNVKVLIPNDIKLYSIFKKRSWIEIF